MNDSLASSGFFSIKGGGGKNPAGSPCFCDKKGGLSKTWNMHGHKVSKVSDTAAAKQQAKQLRTKVTSLMSGPA